MNNALKIGLIAASALALSACGVAPAQPSYGYDSGPVVVANAPPPPPYAEVVPVMPFPGAVWIGGYWGWSGGHYAWNRGRWERPRPGYTWVQPRWERRGDRWQSRGGGWVRR
jgi:hypothetical protein